MADQPTRRAFRSKPMGRLYLQALACGWTARNTGSGHVKMMAPKGGSIMVLSKTQNDAGRNLQNNQAVFRRWQRERKNP